MSNRVHIVATKFINARTGEKSLGYRIWDDAARTYDDTWETIPDDDLEILCLVLINAGEVEDELLEFVQENQRGIYINDSWYDWDKLKPVFDRALEEDEPGDGEAVEDKDRRRSAYGPEDTGEQF